VIQFTPALYIGQCRRNFSRILLRGGLEGEYEGGPVKTQTLSSLKASIVRSPLGMNCAGNAIQAEPVCMPNPPRTDSATVREEIGDPNGMKRRIDGTGAARLGTKFAFAVRAASVTAINRFITNRR
jgi:hypothetical protein